MRTFSDERVARWSAALSTIDRAHGIVVTDGRSVGVADSVPSAALTQAGLQIPVNAVAVDDDALRALRRAVAAVDNARDVSVAIRQGHRKLRRWRGRNIDTLVQDGRDAAERFEWALQFCAGDADVPAPSGVLVDEAIDTLPAAVRSRIPAVDAPVVDSIARIAHRLVRVCGARTALRWVDSARDVFLHGDDVIGHMEAIVSAAAGGHRVPGEVVDALTELFGDRFGDQRILRHRLRTAVDQREVVTAVTKQAAGKLDSVRSVHIVQILRGTPDSDWSIPGAASMDLDGAATLVTNADVAWLAAVAPHIPDWLRTGRELWPALTSVSARVAIRLVEYDVPLRSSTISPSALGHLVQLLDDAPDTESRKWLTRDWVVSLLSASAGSGVLLGVSALLRMNRYVEPGREQTAMALALVVGRGRHDVAAALADWANPHADPARVAALAEQSGIESETLSGYLHYRALLGREAALPRSARALLDYDERAAAMVARLDDMLSGTLPVDRDQVLRNERRRLTDPEVHEARRQALRNRVTNQLRSAAAEMRLLSFRAIVDAHARAVLGPDSASIDSVLLSSLVLLLDRADRDVLDRFVRDALGGHAAEWPENTRWIGRLHKFDVQRWLGGFDISRPVAGHSIRYYVEQDRLRALQMGSLFETCLSINSFNGYSALTNAVEANKHVVYGIDESGAVVARKLVAVSTVGELLGYRTYAYEHHDEHEANILHACEQFAIACGLPLGSTGAPEELTKNGWYDDGIEPWLPLRPDRISVADRHLLDDAAVARLVTGETGAGDLENLLGLVLDRRIRGRALHDLCAGWGYFGWLFALLARGDEDAPLLPEHVHLESFERVRGERLVELPTRFDCWLWRRRGVPDADIVRLFEDYQRSIDDDAEIPSYALDETSLRMRLGGRSSEAAAVELAFRGRDHVSVDAVRQVAAAARRLDTDVLALAAHVLGAPQKHEYRRGFADKLTDEALVLVRLASLAGLPVKVLKGTSFANRAVIGHPGDHRSVDDDVAYKWGKVVNYPVALDEARAGDWRRVHRAWQFQPTLLDDPRTVNVIIDCLDDPNQLRGMADTGWLFDLRQNDVRVMVGHPTVRAYLAGAAVAGAGESILRVPWANSVTPVLALVLDGLPNDRFLDEILREPHDTASRWLLAARARRCPGFEQDIARLSIERRTTLASMLASTLPESEVRQLL